MKILPIYLLVLFLSKTALAGDSALENFVKQVGIVGIIAGGPNPAVVVISDRQSKKTYTLKNGAVIPFLEGYSIKNIDYQSVEITDGKHSFTIDKNLRPFNTESTHNSEDSGLSVSNDYPSETKTNLNEPSPNHFDMQTPSISDYSELHEGDYSGLPRTEEELDHLPYDEEHDLLPLFDPYDADEVNELGRPQGLEQ